MTQHTIPPKSFILPKMHAKNAHVNAAIPYHQCDALTVQNFASKFFL